MTVTDWGNDFVKSNQKRLAFIKNIEFKEFDKTNAVHKELFDAAYALDVIEHLDPKMESKWLNSIISCLHDDAIFILGTPNKAARKHASAASKIAHINLKDADELQALLGKYFENVLLFSMNDEVVHTGYSKMAHYLFGIGLSKK